MRHVVFVAPFLLEATQRFIKAVASLPGVAVSLISQDPLEALSPALRGRLAAHWRIDDGLSPSAIAGGVDALSRLGPPHRLLGTLEQLQVPLAEVREHLGIAGMGVKAAQGFRDKAEMKDRLRGAGLPCARHARVTDRAGAEAFVSKVGLPVVVKPPAGAGAVSTFQADDAAGLVAALDANPPSEHNPVLIEEFVRGEEHSFDSLWIDGRPVFHSITRYRPAPLEVLRNRWIQWCVVLPREVEDPRYDPIREAGTRALEVLGMGTGMSHLEWFRRDDGQIAISEAAARPPGAQIMSLIAHAHHMDFHLAWAGAVVHGHFDPPSRRDAAGIAYLRGQGEGRIVALHGLDRAQRELGHLVVEARLPEPGQAHQAGYEGDGWVILRHAETATVEGALSHLIQCVQVELG